MPNETDHQVRVVEHLVVQRKSAENFQLASVKKIDKILWIYLPLLNRTCLFSDKNIDRSLVTLLIIIYYLPKSDSVVPVVDYLAD